MFWRAIPKRWRFHHTSCHQGLASSSSFPLKKVATTALEQSKFCHQLMMHDFGEHTSSFSKQSKEEGKVAPKSYCFSLLGSNFETSFPLLEEEETVAKWWGPKQAKQSRKKGAKEEKKKIPHQKEGESL